MTTRLAQMYFMDNSEDTEPRPLFSFAGCLVCLNGKELKIESVKLRDGSEPRVSFKFMAEGECV